MCEVQDFLIENSHLSLVGGCSQMFDAQPTRYSPICPRCSEPVRLEDAKTDEDGRAIHEDCYYAILQETTLMTRRRIA
jgi:hypothetical protein